jgi:hypothetical protein
MNALETTEISEWFEWLREELPFGGVRLPDEETAVLFIAQAQQLAYRAQGVYRHLPDSLRQKLIRAVVVYKCWEAQARVASRILLREEPSLLPSLAATLYIAPTGMSQRHHVVEASDGIRYVVTVPNPGYSDKLQATEAICNRLARLAGLTVPDCAIITLGPKLLGSTDNKWPDWLRGRGTERAISCCGSRFVEPSAEPLCPLVSPPRDAETRNILSGTLAFDIWVANYHPGRLTFATDPATGRKRILSYSFSHCLADSDWGAFINRREFVEPCCNRQLFSGAQPKLKNWGQRLRQTDLNQIWQLAFEMPPSWYGYNRMSLARVLDNLSFRKSSLDGEIDRLTSQAASSRKLCRAVGGCPSALACRNGLARTDNIASA